MNHVMYAKSKPMFVTDLVFATKQANVRELLGLIKQCGEQGSLERGKTVHSLAIKTGCQGDKYVISALITMYSRCSSIGDARAVFDSALTQRDVVSWNSLVLGYVENGEFLVALDLFWSMDVQPNRGTFLAAIKACTGLCNILAREFCLERGKAVHKLAKHLGFDTDIYVATTLVGMYSRCGKGMSHARAVFDNMTERNGITWNVLLLGYVENRQSLVAMELFTCMDDDPNPVTFVAVLKACILVVVERQLGTNQFWLEKGIHYHREVVSSRCDTHIFVANSLVEMYSKCGNMIYARAVFDRISYFDVVSWNNLILGYVENGNMSVAMDVFTSMDCEPDSITYVAVIKACIGLATVELWDRVFCLHKAVQLHKQAKKSKKIDAIVAGSLVNMYSKCSAMLLAKSVFNTMTCPNLHAWTSLCLGYVEDGESRLALALLTYMECEPSAVTFVAGLKACSRLACEDGLDKQFSLEKGIQIHRSARECRLDSDMTLATSLVEMYCRCGSMCHAQAVFDSLVRKDVILWTSLITGYVEDGRSLLAMEQFTMMDCTPDQVALIAMLKACSRASELSAGQRIHAYVCKLGLEEDHVVATCLVDLYAKCGRIASAEQVFNGMFMPDTVTWTALIAGYGSLGQTAEVLRLVRCVHEAGLQPNEVTFLAILTSCNHAGLVEEGRKCFESMPVYGIEPTLEHYACMVDLFRRANRLQEALSITKEMQKLTLRTNFNCKV